ncbi:GAF domain-containing protein [Hymenobacter nivis]|uniref:GAF domain-containing protein n=1 Tax=Hymenobacter nivis TaxID=1850093 RepID=A0A2Z3GQY8_9BACT|nr:GAF domain-containing protein [Hymenobacter nivis]AWM34532.1 hypothetical protein DDQ68_18140 [Hymenobacter nivis]
MSLGLNYGLGPGLDIVDRGETLCSVAMLSEETTVFENLHDHPCDLINPFLVKQLYLGFYAGHALRTAAGYPIGVLCIIGHEPRTFSEAESELLARLATVVMACSTCACTCCNSPPGTSCCGRPSTPAPKAW